MECTPADVLAFFAKLFSWNCWKYMAAGAVAAGMNFVGDAPAMWQKLLIALLVFMVLDLILGISVSVAVRGQKVSSAGFQRAVLKTVVYGVVFIVSAFVDHLFSLPYTFSFLVLTLCVLREGTSIGENSRTIWEHVFPGVPFPLAFVFDKLQELSPKKRK